MAFNKSTRILLDDFIDKCFSGENKVAIKEEVLEKFAYLRRHCKAREQSEVTIQITRL